MLGKAGSLGHPNKLALMGTLGIPPRETAAVSNQEVTLSQTEKNIFGGITGAGDLERGR